MTRGLAPDDPAPDELGPITPAELQRARLTLPPRRDDPGHAAWLAEHRRWWTLERCQLDQRLTELLDDGSGVMNPALTRLWLNLVSMPRPYRGVLWINNNPHVRDYLRGLARGDIPLTHQALHELDSWRTTAHLRDLLMDARALSRIDRQITMFERWYHHRLTQLDDPAHVRLLRQFTTWRLLPKLHRQAARAPLTSGSRNTAAGRFNSAATFLTWLADRSRTLAALTQADVDTWHVQQRDPTPLHAFLKWAMTSGHAPRLNLPAQTRNGLPPISQDRRLSLLRCFLTDTAIPLRTRVAGCLVLLYAQPVSRLVRLTIHDIHHDDGEVRLRLGDPPTPVPEPFAAMLIELAAHRANMNTATNPDADWLFPGARAGQPLTPGALQQQLRPLGLLIVQTRTAAFRQLVLQAPAPVVAQALGYHHNTATKHVTTAGGTWSRYPTQRT